MGKDCNCGHDHDKDTLSADEVIENNNFMIHTLLELLIDKKIITEDEFNKKCEALCEEIENENKEE